MALAPLNWLPVCEEFRTRLRSFRILDRPSVWREAMSLANHQLDFVQTNALDHALASHFPPDTPVPEAASTTRLAILGSSTVAHLHAGIRVGGVRRGMRIVSYEADYGQFRQELLDPGSPLHAFRPTIVLFALDAHYLAAGCTAGSAPEAAERALEQRLADLRACWTRAQTALGATVLQQTALPILPDLLGGNEHRLPGSPAWFIDRLNMRLRQEADTAGVHLLGVDRSCRRDGVGSWHDLALWHRAKQEIALPATPLYGDLVARLIACLAGRSYKGLVLDLDNTIWGGVIGDDGMDGIVLGQGSATGEAFADIQRHAAMLGERGVILAVCSKNDEAVAHKAFDEHPEMVLSRRQIASFVANWDDKASNIRRIAEELNIGLDALVFVDDNPFERSLVRRELPMVAVPEVPEDPALVVQCLADAGYFESVAVTADDRARAEQYQLNQERRALAASATDMAGYLGGLAMRLQWSRIDTVGLQRTVQLINKTNQFNLTTRRTTETEMRAVMEDRRRVGLQLRLLDRFGDNGIIGIVIGRMQDEELHIDTWLMSCRVLGREVEQATLGIVAGEARRLGARSLVGEYVPTAKNGMVREHYGKLGFALLVETAQGERSYRLPLDGPVASSDFIQVEEV